jgi:hypothetical protein
VTTALLVLALTQGAPALGKSSTPGRDDKVLAATWPEMEAFLKRNLFKRQRKDGDGAALPKGITKYTSPNGRYSVTYSSRGDETLAFSGAADEEGAKGSAELLAEITRQLLPKDGEAAWNWILQEGDSATGMPERTFGPLTITLITPTGTTPLPGEGVARLTVIFRQLARVEP